MVSFCVIRLGLVIVSQKRFHKAKATERTQAPNIKSVVPYQLS